MRAENEALHRENRQLRAELMEMRRLAEESGRYQRLLGLRDATPAETIAARVIAIDASPYFRVARVDIDRGEGTVRRGMPVLTPEGVVGRINRVAGQELGRHAAGRSALGDRRASCRAPAAAASCAASRARTATAAASSTWRAASRPRKATRSSPAAWAARSRATWRSDTSRRIIPGAVGLYQDVEVTPDVDFARLSDVLVVVAPPPAPDPDPALAPHARRAGWRCIK